MRLTDSQVWRVLYGLGMLIVALVAVFGARTLHAACDYPPSFALDGEACTPERQELQCVCSENLQWDHAEGAQYYVVWRRSWPDQDDWRIVGDTIRLNRYFQCLPGCRDMDTLECPESCKLPDVLQTYWPVAFDDPFPRVGELYEYGVQSCRFVDCQVGPCDTPVVCSSEEGTELVKYRAAPYACYEGGVEVPCYTAPLASEGR